MPDVVLVLLIELVIAHRWAVHLPPEHNRLVERQSNALRNHQVLSLLGDRPAVPVFRRTHLEKQTKLQPPKVLKVMIPLESVVQVPHTWREMFPSNIVNHLRRHDRPGGLACGLVV
jgi:hypothetical protein